MQHAKRVDDSTLEEDQARSRRLLTMLPDVLAKNGLSELQWRRSGAQGAALASLDDVSGAVGRHRVPAQLQGAQHSRLATSRTTRKNYSLGSHRHRLAPREPRRFLSR